MITSVYETHQFTNPQLPFIFHPHFHIVRETYLPNWHKNIELLYCFNGAGFVRYGTEIFDFSIGDIIAVNADMLHTIGSDNSVEYGCLIIDNSFCVDNGLPVEKLVFRKVIKDPELFALLNRVAAAYANYIDAGLCAVTDIRYAVLGVLRRLCRDHLVDSTGDLSGKTSEYIKNAIIYIHQNLSARFTLDDIAAHIGISKYYLSHEFKAVTGKSIVNSINIIRCTEAKRLIEDGMSVSAAALSCGFENLSYFSRTFKRFFGVFPSTFKKC